MPLSTLRFTRRRIIRALTMGTAAGLLAWPRDETTSNQRLMLAASRGDTKTAQAALRDGADPNVTFYVARQQQGCFPYVPETRLRELCGPTATQSDGNTLADFVVSQQFVNPLKLAVATRNNPLVETLIQYNADVNRREANGESAFAFAAICALDSRGNMKTVDLLLRHGARVVLEESSGHRLIHQVAASKQGYEILQMLLDAGEDINARDSRDADYATPLMWAAMYSPSCIRLLLERGADVNAKDRNGETAWHWALSSGKPECIHLLIAAHADK